MNCVTCGKLICEPGIGYQIASYAVCHCDIPNRSNNTPAGSLGQWAGLTQQRMNYELQLARIERVLIEIRDSLSRTAGLDKK